MKIKLYQCGGESPISEYPLGLGYLKSNCSGSIEIVSDPNDLKNCDLIGLSSSAWGAKESIEILESSNTPVIIGGQITLWKDLCQYNFKHIVVGEGENALQYIIDLNENEKVICKDNIKNIDSLNFPDRGRCGKIVPILSSRGCPWNCHFCSSTNFWKKVRYHSPEYFISEVEYILKTYPKTQALYIIDDLFVANENRFYDIFEIWMKKDLFKKLSLRSFIRSNTFTIEMARAMKKMGFSDVRFGAESGSNKILKLLNKKSTVEDHQRTIDICNSVGIPVRASFMNGIPGETQEDRQATFDFKLKNKGKLLFGGSYAFMPFPGTKFYNNENIIDIDMNIRGVKYKKK